MYLQFYSVKEPSKNHDIRVWVCTGGFTRLGLWDVARIASYAVIGNGSNMRRS